MQIDVWYKSGDAVHWLKCVRTYQSCDQQQFYSSPMYDHRCWTLEISDAWQNQWNLTSASLFLIHSQENIRIVLSHFRIQLCVCVCVVLAPHVNQSAVSHWHSVSAQRHRGTLFCCAAISINKMHCVALQIFFIDFCLFVCICLSFCFFFFVSDKKVAPVDRNRYLFVGRFYFTT